MGHEMDDEHLRRAANPTGRPRPGEDVQMIKVGDREMLPTRVKAEAFRGSDWLFWIAGLSAINGLLLWFAADRMLLIGLGSSLFCHSFGNLMGHELGSTTLIPALTITLEAVLIGFFLVCGLLARRGWLAAIFAGMAAYALDAALLAYLEIWLAVAVHVVVLYFIGRSLPMHFALARERRAGQLESNTAATPA